MDNTKMEINKEKVIARLEEREKWLLTGAPENEVTEKEREYISAMILSLKDGKADYFKEIEKTMVTIDGTTENETVMKKLVPYRRNNTGRKVVLSSLAALAAAGMLLVTVNTSTFATIFEGMRTFLNPERTVAVLTPTQYGRYDYTSYDDIPLQWRKLIWQFKHDRFSLHSVSIYYSQNNTNISSYYTYQDDYLLIMLNLSNAPEATISDRTPDAEFVKQITVDDVIININKFVDTESNDPEDIEYSATFYIDNMEYSVSGNISEYEVEGIATEYVKFAKE